MHKVSLLFPLIFILFTSGFSQVVINEIMADPKPSVGLPEEEFVELFNTSQSSINLLGYQFSDASKTAILPDYELEAEAGVILCKSGNGHLFQAYGSVIELTDFPSLNNGGDDLRIVNSTGQLLDLVQYDTDYYANPLKASGGWSLERINPYNNCDGQSNWAASVETAGGSPGRKNSIFDPLFFDNSAINILNSRVESANTIILKTNGLLDSSSATDLLNYSLGVSIDNVYYNQHSINISLGQLLLEDTEYDLQIKDIENCSQNSFLDTTIVVGIPITPQRGELLINEVLFNPESSGSDFIELFNKSDHLFSSKDLRILELDEEGQTIDFVQVTEDKLIPPQSYMVFTEDANYVAERYAAHPHSIIELSLPNYPDASGTVAVLNASLDSLDVFNYQSAFHHPLITIEDGVSLERISADHNTQDHANWTSAASTDGYGSPTRANSAQRLLPNQELPFQISPQVFSPDNDGIDDFVFIDFASEEDILSASIFVFNSAGRMIKTMLNNGVVSKAFQMRWDGSNDNGALVDNGIYILAIQLYDYEGRKTIYKEACTLVR